MGEIKQTNFRIDQATADAFRKFCEENGLNQAQGFDHIMQVVEMDRAKAAAPERLTEIEEFERYVKNIMATYLNSVELCQNSEVRIREQFSSSLDRKDKTIDDLRAKAEQLQAEKDAAESVAAEAVKAKEQAEKDAAIAEKIRIAAEKTAEDKSTIAATLASRLEETEPKAAGYDKLVVELAEAHGAVRNAEEAAKDAAREAERKKDQAVKEVSDALRAKITDLQDALRDAKSEADAARRDAETAKTAAIAELAEAHRVEMTEIRTRLDARTDDLMKARQQAAEAQLALQQEKERIADLERRLKDALAKAKS